MAYKDEYEVARLHTQSGFRESIEERFEGPFKLSFHMAPPLFARRDPVTGHPRKSRFGGWMYPALEFLARGRFLRGTMCDVFVYPKERWLDGTRVAEFCVLWLDTLGSNLNHHKY